MKIPEIAQALLLAISVSLLTGCATKPRVFRGVDQTDPAFKAAVTAETARLIARGDSPTSAEKSATFRVGIQTKERNQARRLEQTAPLLEILTAFEKPRGCWAYTTTTTSHKNDQTTVNVERFDPFQPEERIWTLLSRNGQTPDDGAQADYRRKRLRAWKKALAKTERTRSESEQTKESARYSTNVDITFSDDNAPTTYTLNRERMTVTFLADLAAYREVYTAQSGLLLGQTKTWLGPSSLLGGSVKIAHFESETRYVLIEPTLPPFVEKTTIRYRGSFFGTDSGEVEEVSAYSDYRRVKCYDDRFGVQIGAPTMMDLLPE